MDPSIEISRSISKYLSLDEATLQAVVKRIVLNVGATSLSDAQEFITSSDLEDILRPLEVRKLIKRWSEEGKKFFVLWNTVICLNCVRAFFSCCSMLLFTGSIYFDYN
jgi:hypothetical protein